MQTVLIVLHLIIVIALVGVVLLQRSEGGGLGLGGGGAGVSGFMTGRGQTNFLTRLTAILAGAFFLTSILLSVLATQGRQQRSIFDTPATQQGAPQAPASGQQGTGGQGGVLDQLRQIQGGQQAPAGGPPQPPQSR
jgi:preprotein translocase subunit SecG